MCRKCLPLLFVEPGTCYLPAHLCLDPLRLSANRSSLDMDKLSVKGGFALYMHLFLTFFFHSLLMQKSTFSRRELRVCLCVSGVADC